MPKGIYPRDHLKKRRGPGRPRKIETIDVSAHLDHDDPVRITLRVPASGMNVRVEGPNGGTVGTIMMGQDGMTFVPSNAKKPSKSRLPWKFVSQTFDFMTRRGLPE